MARYFFDFTDGFRATRDWEGHECASADEARKELLRVLPEVLLSDTRDTDEREVTCSVRDEGGSVLHRASVTIKAERTFHQ